jgi:hypothetical protein
LPTSFRPGGSVVVALLRLLEHAEPLAKARSLGLVGLVTRRLTVDGLALCRLGERLLASGLGSLSVVSGCDPAGETRLAQIRAANVRDLVLASATDARPGRTSKSGRWHTRIVARGAEKCTPGPRGLWTSEKPGTGRERVTAARRQQRNA